MKQDVFLMCKNLETEVKWQKCKNIISISTTVTSQSSEQSKEWFIVPEVIFIQMDIKIRDLNE